MRTALTEEQQLHQRIFALRETVKEQGIENARLVTALRLANEDIAKLTATVRTLTNTLDNLAESLR